MGNNISTTMGEVKVTYSTEMMSLYEYLDRAAGRELGTAVAAAAKVAKVKISSHQVSNSKYTGTVLKYPKYFLDEYFGKTDKAETINNTDDDLPF